MAILKKTLFDEHLEIINVLVNDTDPNSKYFKITELPDTFTGGKNAFLIQGSPELVADTIVKIQIKDSLGNVIYHEPGEGIPEYFEGTSKVVAVYIYPDTSFGPCTITILGELTEYDSNGIKIPVPENWKDTYNVKWQKQINVNPFLANTSKIRFYRRPKIDINESILPIYNRTVSRVTISGSVNGTPILPSSGADYKSFNGVSRYELSVNGINQFSQSMEGEIVTINGLNKEYAPILIDVTTNKKSFVDVPYYLTASSLPNYYSVTPFTSASYTMSYDEEVTLSNSSVSSSFATINITDLETFSGDVNRIKVYASSKNDLGDFQLLEDVQLESNELLLTSSFANQLNVRTGLFTNSILSTFWTSSTGVTLDVDNSILLKSVVLEPTTDVSSSVGLYTFYNKEIISFTKNTEYQLDYTPLLASAAENFGGLEIYFSGSAFVPTSTNNYGKKIGELFSNTSFRKYDKQQINFKPDVDGTGNIVFVGKGGVWHIADISLRAAQESAFSPNEITLTVNVPVKINNEGFDFKFELYDINNNYVPVILEKEFVFSGGNDISVKRDLEINVSNNSFNFSTGSSFPQSITIDYTTSGLTGSVRFQSQSVDVNGNLITGTPKPGTLDYVDVDTKTLSLANFTGSSSLGVTVGAITYTASCEDINRYFTIFRIDQGAPARLFYATADKNTFTFDPDNRYKSSIDDDYIDIRLVRQNLPAYENEGFNITSGSEVGTPPPLHEIESIGNATVYRLFVTSSTHQYSVTPISGSGYVYDFGQSHYDFKYDTVDGDFTSSITIDAVLKGDKGKGLIATSDRNQFFYKMTTLDPTPSSQTATILVKRQNLGSLTTSVTYTKSGSGPNLTLVSQNIGNGVAQFSVDTSAYTYGMGDTKYTFQATDLNGTIYYDEVSLSAVIAEAQIAVNLSNENATLPAYSTGWVASCSFIATSGSVSVKVGAEDITREEGLSTNNRWDIISATGTNCTPNDTTPDDATYGINVLSADSGSVSLVIRYKDGRGTTTDITKIVTYSKAKAGVPNIIVAVTPSAQSIESNSKGSGSATPNALTITALEGGTSRFSTLGTPSYTNGLSGTTSTNTLTFTSNASSMSADTGQVTIPVNYIDSEGTSGTKNIIAGVSKARKAAPTTLALLSSETQTILSSSAGYATPSTFTTTVTEGGSNYSYDASLGSNSTYYISSITGGSNSSGTITPTTPTATTGTTVSLTISYKNSEGTTGTITKTHKVAVSLEGVKGADGSPGNTGADGKRTATGLVYYQLSAASAPSPSPSATSFTFSTGNFSGLTANWDKGAPTFAAGNSNKYWYSTYTAVETTAGGDTAIPTFSTPAQAIGFTGLVTFTSANNLTDGTNVINHVPSGSITNHIGGANVTTIEGGKISTGVITSTGYTIAGGETLASGSYTTSGTIINLDNGSIRSKNFYVATNGDAFFKGTLSAAAGTFAGNLSAAGGTFAGNLSAAGGTFAGKITAGAMSLGNDVDGTSDGIYINSTNYWYADGTFKFGSGKVTYDGTTMTIASGVSIGGTLASTVVAGAADGANALQPGEAASDVNSNSTNISGNKIRTGAIASNNHSGTADGSDYSTDGMSIDLTGGGISAKNFRITSAGAAYFKGNITGGTISIGSNFSVDASGNVNATNANLTGTVSATAGTIGGWTITGTGYLQNSTGKLKINPATPSIEIYDSSDAKRLDIHYGSLTFLGSNTIYIDPNSITLPNTGLSGNVDSGYVYSSAYSFYVGEAGTYQKQINWSAVNSVGYISDTSNSYLSIGRGVEIRDGSGNVVGNMYAPGVSSGWGGGADYLDWPAYTMYASLSFPSAGTYYAYTYYYYYAYFQSGVTGTINGNSWDQGSVSLDMENNLVEITDAGIQIAKNPNQYLKFPRDYGTTIVDGKGVANFNANDENDYAIRCMNSVGAASDALYLYAMDRAIHITNGNLWMAAGSAYKPGGGSWSNSSSDRRVKKNENELSGSLSIINSLKPKTFEFKNQNRPEIERGTQIGFIAQDVEEVRPQWVENVSHKSGSADITAIDPTYYEENKSGSVDIKTISFGTDMTAILVGAIKELTAKVEMLEAKLSGSI